MKICVLAILAVSLCAFPVKVYAKDPPENLLLNLPANVSDFTAEDSPKTYEDKALGASLGYNGPDGTAITIYLYDMGAKYVEDGISSKTIAAAKDDAVREIQEAAGAGNYGNLNILSDSQINLSSRGGGSTKVLWVYCSYELNTTNQRVFSDIYVVGLSGYICKVRVTHPKPASSAKEAVADLLSVLAGGY